MLLKVLPVPCLFIITAVFGFYLPTKLYDFTILATAVNIHYLTFVYFYLFLTKKEKHDNPTLCKKMATFTLTHRTLRRMLRQAKV